MPQIKEKIYKKKKVELFSTNFCYFIFVGNSFHNMDILEHPLELDGHNLYTSCQQLVAVEAVLQLVDVQLAKLLNQLY